MSLFRRPVYLLLGPGLSAALYVILSRNGLSHPMAGTAAMTIWMATWWITEVVELGITSLLPIVLLPLLGIMDTAAVSQQYMEQTIFLFMGGFFLAFAMEKWNLHQRLAYTIIQRAGSTPVRVLIGIMITTFLISMWISNTATTLMMLTAVTAIIGHDKLFEARSHQSMATGYLLALTYTASIGGLATLVGTPTNMILAGFTDKLFPAGNPVTFNSWFTFGFPFSLLLAIAAFFIIRQRYFKHGGNTKFDRAFIHDRQVALGKMKYEEKAVLVIFMLTVLAWFTRTSIDFGDFCLPGWSTWFKNGKMIKDSTIAIVASLLLFLFPSRSDKSTALLSWNDVNKLPFQIILLFGSGFAIAEAFQVSGLAGKMAEELKLFSGIQPWMLVLAVATLVTLLSEFASNVASIQLMLPVLAPLSISLQIDPLTLMIPATMAASFGYMMPVATAPNTIVYGTGKVKVKDMVRTGLLLNITAIVLLTIYTWLHGRIS